MSDVDARALVADCLRLPLDCVPADGTIETIPGWDSLRHFEIIARVEKVTQRRLAPDEIVGLRSVRDVAALMSR
ncbi:MAG: hypothetical protein B7Y80_19170 [Hyphomicrobium sp. 32-62-53]|jgi:acyl carrier protein|nr:MAG: hypothetical protein B7Z29_18025 [Hyphomicrobium sp. 12-62-95]OYX97544.1 MAG: hypothetical protein B7Y80_19170 [Hyphomicrobium sp. 32-62-53]